MPEKDSFIRESKMKWKTKKETYLIQIKKVPIEFTSSSVGLTNGERFNESAVYLEKTSSGKIITRYGEPTSFSLEDELFIDNIHLVIGDSLYRFYLHQQYPFKPIQKVSLLLFGLQPLETT